MIARWQAVALALALAVAVVALLVTETARGAGARRGDQATVAIAYVFGPYASEALRVAWCESRFQTYARNGQYLGLFQMGSYARARYGHAWNPWAQAISAYRYFVDSGRDWSPWSCRP